MDVKRRHEAPTVRNLSDDGGRAQFLRWELFSLRVRGAVGLHSWRPTLRCPGISMPPQRPRLYRGLCLRAYSSHRREMSAARQMASAAGEEWRFGRSCWAAPSAVFRSLHEFAMRPSLNQSRQPTPGVRLARIPASVARRGCAHRWPASQAL